MSQNKRMEEKSAKCLPARFCLMGTPRSIESRIIIVRMCGSVQSAFFMPNRKKCLVVEGRVGRGKGGQEGTRRNLEKRRTT